MTGEVDYIIVGQGISGTWLSYFLAKEGMRLAVIDKADPSSASRVAAGVINPVTGRRHVTVWMAEEILPFAWQSYTNLGHELNINAISQKTLLDFFPSSQMRESFLQRVEEKSPYLHTYPEQNHFNTHFQYDFGCGEIRPVYIAHLENILPAWRKELGSQGMLVEEEFEISGLEVSGTGVRYGDIKAKKIIFCDGIGGTENPWFKALPFAPNKGETLVVEIPGLPDQHIYKKGMVLVPLEIPGHWWAGSTYAWEFENDEVTTGFREKTEQWLQSWIKIPFQIKEQHAAIRPATLERRPFVGLHPVNASIGILNGMGTKGCSLAPYFAKQLSDLLVYNLPVAPEADIARFSKVLSREA